MELNALLDKMCGLMPQDSEAGVDSPADQLRAAMQRQWDAPAVESAASLWAQPTDEDDVRATLFAPRPEHAPRYVRAVSRLAGDDAHKKLAVTHLTLLYMGHLRVESKDNRVCPQ